MELSQPSINITCHLRSSADEMIIEDYSGPCLRFNKPYGIDMFMTDEQIVKLRDVLNAYLAKALVVQEPQAEPNQPIAIQDDDIYF